MQVRFQNGRGERILEGVGDASLDNVPRYGESVIIKDQLYQVHMVTWYPYHGPYVVVTLVVAG